MGFLKNIYDFLAPGETEEIPKDLGRNDDCWCGSGRKYKKCHLEGDMQKLRSRNLSSCGKT